MTRWRGTNAGSSRQLRFARALAFIAASMFTQTSNGEVLPGASPVDIEIDSFVETSLSTRSHFDPTSLSLDVTLRLDEHVLISIEHSARAANLDGMGRGLCLRDEECRATYTAPSFAVGYEWHGVRWRFAPRAGLVTRGMDPWRLAVEFAVRAQFSFGRSMVSATAAHWHGLHLGESGNAPRVHAFAHYWHQVAGQESDTGFWLGGGLGVRTATDTFPDAVRVPISFGVAYRRPAYDVGVEYELARLLGSLNDPKPRFMMLFLTVRPAIDLHRRPVRSSTAD